MRKTSKRNLYISAAFAAITGIISYLTKSLSLVEALRWIAYDFLILQIFLIVLEIYNDYLSEASNLMKEEKYKGLIQGLGYYEKKEHKDVVLDNLLTVLIEECARYSRLESVNGQSISIDLTESLAKRLFTQAEQRRVMCHIAKLDKIYIEKSTEIILLYENYTDLYTTPWELSELSEKYNILFYREPDSASFEAFCLLNNNVLLKERDNISCWVYTYSEEVNRYSAEYDNIRAQSALFETAQKNDSLFIHTSIQEFYGPGNPPDLHLDMINTTFRRILDIGTGSGRILRYFTDSTKYKVTAMDQDIRALEECRKEYGQYGHISLSDQKFTEDSFVPGEFDLVIAFNSLYHTTRAKLFARIKRVHTILRAGGYFILTLKTLEGNEEIYQNANEVGRESSEHTYLNTKFPDGHLPHHFCDSAEIDMYIKMFSEVVYQEKIKLEKYDNDIVQGQGMFYILRK